MYKVDEKTQIHPEQWQLRRQIMDAERTQPSTKQIVVVLVNHIPAVTPRNTAGEMFTKQNTCTLDE